MAASDGWVNTSCVFPGDERIRIRAVTWIVRASLALWGLALAIGLAPRLQHPAGPHDLPGAMRNLGLSASGPTAQFALLIVLPFLAALLATPLLSRVTERRWVAWSFCITLAGASITVMHFGTARHVVLHGLFAAAIVCARRLQPRFSRADLVLVPALLSLFFAFFDVGFGKTPAATLMRAAMILFALRLVIGALSKSRRPGLAFAAAPMAFVFQMHWLEPRLAAYLAISWIVVTSFVLMRVADDRLRKFAAYVAYPVAVAAYPFALLGVLATPQLDLFEDSHSLLPASEMARGERPYRDVVPMHGFISDGLLDVVAMKAIAPNLGTILATRRWVSALTMTAIYFAALGVTTSAELALMAVFLSLGIYPAASIWMRAMPAMLVLGCIAAGTRLRARRWFLVAGVVLVIAALMSLDLAVFAAIVALIAAIRARALRPLFLGITSAAIPLLIVFAAFGFAGDFIRTTVVEVIGAGGVYVVGPLEAPQGLRTLAHLIARLEEYETLAALCWVIALITAAAALSKSPLRAKRSDAVWMVALWIVLGGASYVVRHHYYFAFALGPFLVGALLAMRRHSRPAAIALTIVLVFFAKPFSHIFDLALPLRRAGGVTVPQDWSELTTLPRARGAVMDARTKAGVESVQRFLHTSLKPEETFYDFASVGVLYYLFDRNSPARHPTVPAYETEALQRELIESIEKNSRVRAALIAFPTAYPDIDGVHNRDRAPLIWQYLQEHFQPAFDENGVVFWVRR
jgi:hypothetical protein